LFADSLSSIRRSEIEEQEDIAELVYELSYPSTMEAAQPLQDSNSTDLDMDEISITHPPASLVKVFQTTELLQEILLALPTDRHLLLSQRACKAFRDMIQGSLSLTQKIFLHSSHRDSAEPAFNPLLSVIAAPVRLTRCGYHGDFKSRVEVFKVHKLKAVVKHKGELWALADVVYQWPPSQPRGLFRGLGRARSTFDPQSLLWGLFRVASNEELSCPTFDLATSSLRAMYLTQPAVAVTVVLYHGIPDAKVLHNEGWPERHKWDPRWTVVGCAYSQFKTKGLTIGEIFGEVDRINRDYRVPNR
jgi:hypothetical protein